MFTLAFDRAARLLLVRFGAALDPDIHRAMMVELGRFVARHGAMDAIIDFGAVEKYELDAAYFWTRAAQRPVLHGKRRILVAPTDLVYGTSRLYQALQSQSGDAPIVVRTMAEALEIAGVAAPDFEPVPPSPPA